MSAAVAEARGVIEAIQASRTARWMLTAAVILGAILLPFAVAPTGGFIEDATLAAAYTVMALGLNIVVGFAGLLDLGYVAFYALGAYTVGWFASSFFSGIGGGDGVHSGVPFDVGPDPTGLHLNFVLVVILAALICALAGAVIGLPTLRLRGDYIAIVTLAFGEIIGRFALNGDTLVVDGYKLTNGRQGVTPVDNIDLPLLEAFSSVENRRPFYWLALALALIVLFVNFRLRDSRLGRAWIAIREDEVAAASMGVPLVKTKLMAYAVGAAFGGMSGAFLGALLNTVNADSFLFSFSIFVLSMIILGGLGSIWGVVFGAIVLTFINYWLIPDQINEWPSKVGLDFDLTQLSFGIFGFLLVLVMVLRPQGLFPERRRKLELTEGVGTGEEAMYEARG
jgi:branched-chain amino acid transport system permease protein